MLCCHIRPAMNVQDVSVRMSQRLRLSLLPTLSLRTAPTPALSLCEVIAILSIRGDGAFLEEEEETLLSPSSPTFQPKDLKMGFPFPAFFLIF
ncbi:hypothetical protein PVK06_042783 [Gossypium arboreum]|uniref:Uncharacterized protein n=1 Tax=Gossypium arboreum TaxID=29729 RepID=A0ABR0MLN3_GOSAR|nr:hypothetical protein PVK06_042783 [Gossypium arboreum]